MPPFHLLHNGVDNMSMGGDGGGTVAAGSSSMDMTFNTNWQSMTLLFPTWQVNNGSDYALTVLCIFVIAMSFELLGSCHRMFNLRFTCSNHAMIHTHSIRAQGKSLDDESVLNQPSSIPLHDTPYTWPQQIFCGILHVFKAFVSFVLMVVFMTLDVGLCMSLLLGLFSGFVFFHPSNSVESDGIAGIFAFNAGSIYSNARTPYQSLFNHNYQHKATQVKWNQIRHRYFGWMNQVVRVAPTWSIGELLVCISFIVINIGLIIPALINLAAPNDCPSYAYDNGECNTWNTVMLQVDMLGLLGCGDAMLMLFPITRNSLVLLLTGIPYEQALKWHRYTAYWTLLVFTLHGIAAIWYYSLKDSLTQLTYADSSAGFGDCALYGLIAYAAFCIAIVTSFSWVRRAAYNIFYYTHIPMFLVFLGIGSAHKPLVVTWFLIGPAALWAIDLMIRWSSKLEPTMLISMRTISSDVTELVFLKSQFKYVAGQYVFISVDALGTFNTHPVSIASAPHEPYVRCYIRASKLRPSSWSSKLYDLADKCENGEQQQPYLYVDGPYGSTEPHQHTHYNSRHITLIAGGIGITNIRSLLYDITNAAHVQQVTLVWCVRDIQLLELLHDQSVSRVSDGVIGTHEEELDPTTSGTDNLEEAEILLDKVDQQINVDMGPRTQLKSHIYLTNTQYTQQQFAELQQHHPQHIIYHSRPQLSQYINGESDVIVCGPESLLRHSRSCHKLLVKNGHTSQYREDTFSL